MVVIGYSISKFHGKQDNKDHDLLSVIFSDYKEDDKHSGYFNAQKYYFVDKPKEFYQMINEYYQEEKELELLFNSYGKVVQINEKKK